MSVISDSIFNPAAGYETKWDDVIVVAAQASSRIAAPTWRPAVNAYRCADQFLVYVELAGVPPEAIQVQMHGGRLVIRGQRPAPEPTCSRSELAQLLALEIDQGAFERIIDLPQDVDATGILTEYCDGVLKIRLPLMAT